MNSVVWSRRTLLLLFETLWPQSNKKMRPFNNKEPRRSRSQSRSSSPIKDRTRTPTSSTPPGSRPNRLTPSTSLLDRELIVTEGDTTALFEELRVSSSDSNNPRSFPYSVKQQCWDKADKVRGRDPDRWRRDPLGNLVFRKLVGCAGCLCHDYDHILPYSKVPRFFIFYVSWLEFCEVGLLWFWKLRVPLFLFDWFVCGILWNGSLFFCLFIRHWKVHLCGKYGAQKMLFLWLILVVFLLTTLAYDPNTVKLANRIEVLLLYRYWVWWACDRMSN